LIHSQPKGSNLIQLAILGVLFGIFIAVVVGAATQNKEAQNEIPSTPPCSGFSVKYTPYFSRPPTSKFSLPPGNVFVSNARIWTVDTSDSEIVAGNLLIQDGVIVGVGQSVHPPDNFRGTRIDAAGRYLTPGFLIVNFGFQILI